jgi:GH35 family endo-1,4-beta-xylanase
MKNITKIPFLLCALAGTQDLPAQTLPAGERLRDLTPPGFYVGGIIGRNQAIEPQWAALRTIAQREFNLLTMEAFTGVIEPAPNSFNWTYTDNMAAIAAANGQKLTGHVLVYPTDTNKWCDWWRNLDTTSTDPQRFEKAMYNHIDKVAGRYSGRMMAWDVVNEALTDTADVPYHNPSEPGVTVAGQNGATFTGLRTKFQNDRFGGQWENYREFQEMGESYIKKAFIRARAADPYAQLLLCDYNCEQWNTKSTNLYNLVKTLRQQGVPIDGIGFQAHIDPINEPFRFKDELESTWTGPNSITANFQRFADLGLNLYITEFDVRMRKGTTPYPNLTAAEGAKQRNIYSRMLKLALDQPAFDAFKHWDFTDRGSWLHPFGTDYYFPAPFNMESDAKEAYYGLQQTLKNFTGNYRISCRWNSATGFLNRASSTSPNATLGTLTAGSNQKWRVERVSPGVYRLKNAIAATSPYMDRGGVETAPGSGLWLPSTSNYFDTLRPNDYVNQLWQLTELNVSLYQIRNQWGPDSGVLTRNDNAGQPTNGLTFAPYYPTAWSQQWFFDRVK